MQEEPQIMFKKILRQKMSEEENQIMKEIWARKRALKNVQAASICKSF